MIKEKHNDFDNFLLHIENCFSITVNDARAIIESFHQEMNLGLAGKQSSLKMIPSFVSLPKGTEKGRYLVLDLGGTNIRIMDVELDGKGNISVAAVSRFVIPNEAICKTGKDLFDFIASSVGKFFEEHEIGSKASRNLAFTFSFPLEQRSLASGILIGWTKNFTAKGVVGKDVVVMLSEALKRKSMGFINVVALANDTVGTLMAKRYADSSCDMGVIIGTGTNACYPEKPARILKCPDLTTFEDMIINMEWGGFSKLKMNVYDEILDDASHNAGMQLLEKMVSGMYLGEIARLVIVEMITKGLIFSMAELPVFSGKYTLHSEHLSIMAQGSDFFKEFGVSDASETDRKAVREICRIVSARSARIAGSAIAAVVTWMDPLVEHNHTVAIDGALFEKYPGYRYHIEGILRELFEDRTERITLELVKDGSGIGLAVIGAVAVSSC